MSSITPYRANIGSIRVGGVAQPLFYAPLFGGVVANPYSPVDQGIAVVETLYVDFTGPPGLAAGGTTFAVQPGGSLSIPSGTVETVWVNAATSGHMFSAFVLQPVSTYTPSTAVFPPSGPTGLTKITPSYLYQEYNDDEDLQAFVQSYNELSQSYLTWFNNTPLPIYTDPLVTGTILDWVALGAYGMSRPSLPSDRNQNVGAFNTYAFNQIGLNVEIVIGNQNYYVTTDDIFKRVLTWHFYKGDGKTFTIRWLKRRIMRFLLGTNGAGFNVDQTYPVSVSFGTGNQVNINIGLGVRTVVGGALYNMFRFNTVAFNELDTKFTPSPALPMAVILKAAIESGVLELPFQFTYVVNVA